MNKSDTIAVIRSLLSSTKNPYSVPNLNSDFKDETGADIPLFGYANLGDFLCSIPDTVEVTGIYPVQKVTLVTNEKSAHIVSLVQRQRNSDKKKRPLSKTRTTARKYPAENRINGFWKHRIHAQKESNCSVEYLNEQNNILNESDTSLPYSNIIPTNTALSNSTDALVSLEHFLGPGDSIPHINVQLHAQVGGYVEVHPCKIINPHKFYFHFRKFKKKFSEFRDRLQMFYTTHSTPKVTDEAIRPRLMCALLCGIHGEPTWHRVEVKEVSSGAEVLVDFVDHGNVMSVSKENLKFLHRDFGSFPRQASLGSLANIRPAKGSSDWSVAAISRFSHLSLREDLVGGVVHVNPKDFCVSVALSYTKGKEIHINDTLVKEGYAEFDKSILDVHQDCFGDSLRGNEDTRGKITEDREFVADVLKTVQRLGLRPNPIETPVFYYSDDCIGNNNRLIQMFSFCEEKLRKRVK